MRTAVRGGVFHYLVKPFEIESLRQRLSRVSPRTGPSSPSCTGGAARTTSTASSAAQAARAAGRLPKGISPDTTELVLKALEEADDEGLSATECAESTGLSRSSTRRYLEHLVSIGTAEMRPRYGAAGRPERRYRVR